MASVFLSYSREDAAKAKSLAQVLEKAGHEVWWDRHISSGSDFSGAIEQALKRADAVLVLWSKASIASSWVRDEAAEGRDSGRLVPVVLDDCRPPMGFRQVQSMDLSGWSGRGTPKHFADLLKAIAEKDESPVGATPQPPATSKRGRLAVPLLALAAAAALVLLSLWLYRSWTGPSAETPTIAVLPFADLSPQRDKAYFSEGVAEEILSVLARDPGIRVIGRSSSRQFQDANADLSGIRKALGVTHVLEGSARTAGDELRMSVRLIDASNGSQVWAEDYQRKMSNIFAVQAEIGRAVAQRLSGSLSTKLAERQSTGVDTYTLYLAARAKMRERTRSSLTEALNLARRALAADPNYAPGHAIYAELLWLLSDDNYGESPVEKVWPVAKRHALLAIKLAPDQPEGYAALGTVPPPTEAAAALKKAIQLDPSRSELRLWLAGAYQELGRNEEALREYRAAAEMEPLWAPAVRNLSNTLSASGLHKEAEDLIRRFEERGGDPAQTALTRSQNAWMRGDLSEAVRHSEEVIRIDRQVISSSPPHPFLYHDLGFFRRAGDLAPRDARFQLFVTGRYKALAQLVRRDGLWGKPATGIGLEALALTRDWAGVEAVYDARPAGLDICAHEEGPMIAIHFATALSARGRASEAARLLPCTKRRLATQAGGPIYSAFYPENYLAALNAQILALERKDAAALQEMRRAYRLGFWSTHGLGLSVFPALDQYRSTPEYAALDSGLKRKAATERAQTLQHSPSLR
jgi:adenylate cyclase